MIILYDSKCAFCNAVIHFFERKIAPGKLEGKHDLRTVEARQLLKEQQVSFIKLNTIYVIDKQVYLKSAAIFRIIRRLVFPFRLLYVFSVFPVSFSNKIYDFIAAHRYRIMGKLSSKAIVQANGGEVL